MCMCCLQAHASVCSGAVPFAVWRRLALQALEQRAKRLVKVTACKTQPGAAPVLAVNIYSRLVAPQQRPVSVHQRNILDGNGCCRTVPLALLLQRNQIQGRAALLSTQPGSKKQVCSASSHNPGCPSVAGLSCSKDARLVRFCSA